MSSTGEGASSSDNRQSQRAPIRLRVDYERMNAFFADYTKNISRGGTYIKTARPLPMGTRFEFALSVPALSEPVALTGEVIRVQETATSEHEPGMGVRFVFESDEERTGFGKLVERLFQESFGPEVAAGLLATRD